MPDQEYDDARGAMLSSAPHHHLSSVMDNEENQTADSLLPLGPKNTACGNTPPRTLGDNVPNQLGWAVLQVKQFLAALSFSGNNWLHLKLSSTERNEVVEHFGNDPRFNDCRHDYFITDHTFSIGMETHTHSSFRTSMIIHIEGQIENLRQNQDPILSQFAGKITSVDNGTIKLETLPTKNSHTPDATVKYRLAKFPGIVIEVAHSQRKEALSQLAQEYILGSGGNIQCVIGLKTAYLKGEPASLSVWESAVDVLVDGSQMLRLKQIVKDQVFRTADGLANTEFLGLSLSLTHLAPNTEIARELQNVPKELTTIQISTETLCQLLNKAEEDEEASQNGLVRDFGGGGLKIEIPEFSPPEEVSGDRLRKFEVEEERAKCRREAEDADYVE